MLMIFRVSYDGDGPLYTKPVKTPLGKNTSPNS
jgi:hypothetical protein